MSAPIPRFAMVGVGEHYFVLQHVAAVDDVPLYVMLQTQWDDIEQAARFCRVAEELTP